MGTVYTQTEQYVIDIPQGNIVVEIGSDRGEGSTAYFANLAKKHNSVLHSVDILPTASDSIQLDNVTWHIAKGSEWASKYMSVDKKISVLYLDNFDYIWNATRKDSSPKSLWSRELYNNLKGGSWPEEYVEYDLLPEFVKMELHEHFNISYDAMMEDMKKTYSDHGMELNNRECQLEHFKQLFYLIEWLADECVVVFDDTFKINDCWIGKNAGGVLLLQTLGFLIVKEDPLQKGLILKRFASK